MSTVFTALLRFRWFRRAPIWLYRARLGFLFGTNALLLRHRGRVSGRTRHAVLMVIDRPRHGSYAVVSGFGAGAQWLRNVQADPHVHIQLGAHRPTAATAHRLDPDTARAALARYAAANAGGWQLLRAVLHDTLGTPADIDTADVPVVAFDTLDR